METRGSDVEASVQSWSVRVHWGCGNLLHEQKGTDHTHTEPSATASTTTTATTTSAAALPHQSCNNRSQASSLFARDSCYYRIITFILIRTHSSVTLSIAVNPVK
jgi:hypothetical protein